MLLSLAILFFLWPFGSLPLILYLMYYQKKYAYYFLGAFLTLLTMYYPPSGDQLYYWIHFNAFSFPDGEIFLGATEKRPVVSLIFPILFFFSKLGTTFELTRAVIIFSIYTLCISWLLKRIASYQNLYSKRIFFIWSLLFIFSIPWAAIMTGFRWGISTVLLFLGIFECFFKNKVYGAILLFLSCFFHFAICPLVLLFLTTAYFRKILWKNIVGMFICCVAVSILLDGIISYILEIPFFNFIETYLSPEGTWRTGELPYEISRLNQIGTLVAQYIFYLFIVLVLYRLFGFIKSNSQISKATMLPILYLGEIIALFILFVNFYTISERLQLLIILFSSGTFFTLLLTKDQINFTSQKKLFLYSLFIIFFFIFSFISLKKPFSAGGVYAFFYSPFFFIIQKTFSYEWVLVNIDF